MNGNNLWPCCEHGYYITPSHKCPWCFSGDTRLYRHPVGPGNGWLLGIDDYACEGCGGPRGAGWGAWAGPDPPTKERVREQLSVAMYCYTCTCAGKAMQRSAKAGEQLTDDERKKFQIGCPDCGKRWVSNSWPDLTGVRSLADVKARIDAMPPRVIQCLRLACGSGFEVTSTQITRTTDAVPTAPPPKRVLL